MVLKAARRSEAPLSRLTRLSITSDSPRAFSSPWNDSASSVQTGRIGEEQREGSGVASRQPPLGRSELSELAHQDAAIRVIGTLEAEVLAPCNKTSAAASSSRRSRRLRNSLGCFS